MVFITQPAEEGETKDCQKCDISLIARWTDYKGKYEDKLQWQTLEPRKAHYDKDGNCKGETSEQAENKASRTPPTPEGLQNASSEKAILEAILHTVIDIKEFVEIIAREKVKAK